MFWQSKSVISAHIGSLLNKEDCTLYELLDDEDILQECKSQNKKLMEFLLKPNVMEELVDVMIKDPSPDVADNYKYKYPHIACEILSCNIPVLNEKVAGLRKNILKRETKQLEFWLQVWKKHRIKLWCKGGTGKSVYLQSCCCYESSFRDGWSL